MNVFKLIDAFFFGLEHEQDGKNKADKLYFYIPSTLVLAFVLFLKVKAGL